MSSTFVITVKSDRSQTDLGRFIESSGNQQNGLRLLRQYFKRIESGNENALVIVQTAAVAPAAASATIVLTYASISNSDKVVLGGATLTGVTGTPSGAQFKIQTNATVTAANLVTLINSSTLTKYYIYASSSNATVTLISQSKSYLGNWITASVTNTNGFTLSSATLTGGTGGAQTTAVTYTKNL